MDDYADRLAAAIEHAHYTPPSLAVAIDVTKSAIYQVLQRRSKMLSTDKHAMACHALGVDSLWLATGQGQMVPKKSRSLSEVPVFDDLRTELQELFAQQPVSTAQWVASDDQAFAVRMPDDRMTPRYFVDELLMVYPSVTPEIDDTVLILNEGLDWEVARLVMRRRGQVMLGWWNASSTTETRRIETILKMWTVVHTIRETV